MRTAQPYRKSLVLSVLLHVIAFSFFIISFDFSAPNFVLKNNSNDANFIHAMIMSAPVVPNKPVPTPTPPPPAPKPIVKPVVKPIMKPLLPKPVAPKVVIKKNVIPLVVKKPKIIPKKEIQKQLLAELKEETVKKQHKQKALEQSFESELRNLSQKKLLQQMASDLPVQTNADNDKMRGVVDKYRALILAALGRHWVIPSNTDKNAKTTLMIRLERNGTVTEVEIYQSSGNVALDNSARAAVFQASPLPVPKDAAEFAPFKQFLLVCRPMMFQSG